MEKRINVISKEIRDESNKVLQQGNMIMRVNRSYAKMLVNNGTHTTTSKSKLKSFLNANKKLTRNKRTIDTYGSSRAALPYGLHGKNPNGKTYTTTTTVQYISIYSEEGKKMLKNNKTKEEIQDLLFDTGIKILIAKYAN